jgi:hypothetical protein
VGELICPNCGQPCAGLYSNAYDVAHCGCFYDAYPGDVCLHITSMCHPEHVSDWEDPTNV